MPQLLRDNIDLIHKFVVLFTESQPVMYETEHYSNFVAFSSSRFCISWYIFFSLGHGFLADYSLAILS